MGVTDFKAKAEDFFLKGWTSYVWIAVALLMLLAILGFTTVYVMTARAKEMTNAHIIHSRQLSACSKIDTPEKLAFINGQRAEITSLGNQHHANAVSYFAYFYATYLVMSVFGLIAAISLAIITKSGINTASPHLISVFLISTAIVVLYQGSLDILKQKANADLNANASIKYAVLADQIDTFCTTGKITMTDPNDVLLAALPKREPTPAANKQSEPPMQTESGAPGKILPFFVEPDGDQFINFVAWQMNHLRGFAITIDDTKVGAVDSKRFMF